MKKRYTKKQIIESIKYWEKQLNEGNYKKLNESFYGKPKIELRVYDSNDELVDSSTYEPEDILIAEKHMDEINAAGKYDAYLYVNGQAFPQTVSSRKYLLDQVEQWCYDNNVSFKTSTEEY